LVERDVEGRVEREEGKVEEEWETRD